MATARQDDLKVYKFEDTQTGKIIQFEGPADATEDEINYYLDTTYANDDVVEPSTAADKPQRQELSAVVVQGYPGLKDVDPRFLGDEREAELLGMMQDPNVSYDTINNYIREQAKAKGRVVTGDSLQGGETALEQYRKDFAASGGKTGGIQYADWQPQIAEAPATEDVEQGWLPAFERAYQDAVQYGTSGIIARKYHDWMDTGKEELRKQFPDATEDQLEEIHENAIASVQKQLRARNAKVTENDPLVPWLAAQVLGSAGIEDFIPGAAATRAGRIGAAAGINTAADVGYQYTDIGAGVQDEFNVEQAMLAPVVGAGFQGGLEGVSRGIARLANGKAAPEGTGSTGRISVPTSRKNSKAYKQELSQAKYEVDNHVNEITKNWTNAPKIKVHDNFKGLDADSDALGLFDADTGVVHLNTEALIQAAKSTKTTVEDMAKAVTFHESLGHYGLDQQYGKTLDDTIAEWLTNVDDGFLRQMDRYRERNPDTYLGDPNEDIRVAEEVIANWANQGYVPRTLWDSFANMVKSVGRSIGMDIQYSERELKALLSVSMDKVVKGKKGAGGSGGKKYATVWHGSGADFDEFDHAFMSSGEGAQVYGWGTYLTDNRKIGESYRDQIGDISPSWDGVNTTWYQVRENAKSGLVQKFGEVKSEYLRIVDDLISDVGSYGELPNDARTLGKFYLKHDQYDPNTNKLVKESLDTFVEEFGPILSELKKRFKVNKTGKLYEVEIPDNVLWNDWDKPLKDQDHIEYLLRQADSDIEIQSYDSWNYIERQYYNLRMKYNDLNATLSEESRMLDTPGVLERQLEEILGHKPSPEALKEFRDYREELADKYFQELQEIAPKYEQAKREYETNFHEEMTGEEFYGKLVSLKGGPQQASEFLKSIGIEGNRYPANFLRGGNTRGERNYVVFSDKTPKIKAKYMKPSDIEGIGKISREDLSADELFESENALDILRRITDDYQSQPMTMSDLRAEADARGMSAAQLMRSKDGPGDLTRKLFMYDIAAEKIQDRVTKLYSKIQSGQFTMADKNNYLQTIAKFEDLSSKIFDIQSEAGRMLRAIQDVNLTRRKAEGVKNILEGLDKDNLNRVLEDDEIFAKFAKEIQDNLENSVVSEPGKAKKFAANALNYPRAIMSSMDLSAPLRQGIFFLPTKSFWTALPQMFKSLGSEVSHNAFMDDIMARPTYEKMMEADLFFSGTSGKLAQREEAFMTEWSDKTPGVRQSNRAYSAFLNKLRADLFDDYFDKMVKQGADPNDKEFLRGLGSFINAGTGRGNLPKALEGARPLLNGTFFSPGLISSRLSLLNPAWYVTLPPHVRKQAIISAVTFGSLAASSLALIKEAFPEVDVEADPRSSDFGKVKIGNTRYDVLGGFSQFITLGARLATNQRKTSTGEIDEYGDEWKEDTRLDVLGKFATNKSAPNVSFILDYLRGSDAIGNEFKVGIPEGASTEELLEYFKGDAVAKRMVPMILQDYAELSDEYGWDKASTMIIPGVFGVGVNTYVTKNLDPEAIIEAPEGFDMADLEDGENEDISVSDGRVTLKPEARQEWERRLNTYIEHWMKEEQARPEWEKMTDKEKAEIISDVRNEARAQTKEDMLEIFGL